jgi:hypothetical protein
VAPSEGKAAKPFVGIAISGGGSRSANFAAAVMEELDRYGFLAHVSAISAVSGGTLPASYYVLNGNRTDWSWRTLRELMASNFYSRLLWKHFNPWGLLKYLLTDYNRSDMMADVFDDVLFYHATFGDLSPQLPQLAINATKLNGVRWVFTETSFKSLNSRLDTYSLSRAVAASTAVPGIFNGISLRGYKADGAYSYWHLLDGGLVDNLGMETLLDFYMRTVPNPMISKELPPACFIFLIDAYPDLPTYSLAGNYERSDLRSSTDYIIDRNLLVAFDILTAVARDRYLRSINGSVINDYLETPFYTEGRNHMGRSYRCTVWHFHFRYLDFGALYFRNPQMRGQERRNLRLILPRIETHWKLVAPGNCSSLALQQALYDAAKHLVTGSRYRSFLSKWFQENGLALKDSIPVNQEEERYEFFENWTVTLEENPNGSTTGRVFCSHKKAVDVE